MLRCFVDYRMGGIPRHDASDKPEHLVRVHDSIHKSVFFLCAKVASSQGAEIVQAGTAFAIGVPFENTGMHFTYLVTAKHVIDDIKKYGVDNTVYIRANLVSGGAGYIEVSADLWRFHPFDRTVDVAALALAPGAEVYDYLLLPPVIYMTKAHKDFGRVGIGDEVFISGLFVNHAGKYRNLPILRTGNIAMMPEEPVFLEDFGDADVYLIESRSIGGLSGSPVFVHKPLEELGHISPGNHAIYLIGLVHGHWDIKPHLPTLGEQSINMGIAIVVTMDKIMEVINQPNFEDDRKKTGEEYHKQNALKKDSALSDENGNDAGIGNLKPE